MRFHHHEAAPYATGTDPVGFARGKLVYVTPNIVLEVVAIASARA